MPKRYNTLSTPWITSTPVPGCPFPPCTASAHRNSQKVAPWLYVSQCPEQEKTLQSLKWLPHCDQKAPICTPPIASRPPAISESALPALLSRGQGCRTTGPPNTGTSHLKPAMSSFLLRIQSVGFSPDCTLSFCPPSPPRVTPSSVAHTLSKRQASVSFYMVAPMLPASRMAASRDGAGHIYPSAPTLTAKDIPTAFQTTVHIGKAPFTAQQQQRPTAMVAAPRPQRSCSQ